MKKYHPSQTDLIKTDSAPTSTQPTLHNNYPSAGWFWSFFILTFIIGAFFRLYLISDQVILDDEWHALNFSIDHSVWYLLTHFSRAGANNIPFNAYVRLLLVSSGWSEILLFLPSLMAGLASLIVFPLAVKRVFGARVTIIFAFLLAFSPLLIFYSRVCRPYSIYTLVGFLCIWVLYEWIIKGEKRFGILYIMLGILCVYFHFVGVIFVFVPLGCAMIIKLMQTSQKVPARNERIIPDMNAFIRSGLIMACCLAALLTLPLIHRLPSMELSRAKFTFQTILGFSQILSGTSNPFLNIFFYTALIAGFFFFFKRSFLLGLIYPVVFIAYIFVSVFSRVNFAHVPLVLARYMIPAFPMAYLLVALGLDSLWKAMASITFNKKFINSICYTAVGSFLFLLILTGPLRQIYVRPNNFTSHSAFQESYLPMDWNFPRQSPMIMDHYTLNKNNMSDFYKNLAHQPNIKKIIEYPMFLGNHFNLFYYYQRFHGKKVAIGYTRSIKDRLDVSSGWIYGNIIADQVLSQIEDPNKLQFQNTVDIMDMAAVKQSQADLVVIHKNMRLELFEQNGEKEGSVISLISGMTRVYQKILGPPVFEDRHLIVFSVPK